MTHRILKNNIKKVRLATTSLTAKEVSKLLGMNIHTYGTYERNNSQPKRETLQHIANFFKVEVDDLIAEKEVDVVPSNTEIVNLVKDVVEDFTADEVHCIRKKLADLYFENNMNELKKELFAISHRTNKVFKFLETDEMNLYFVFINNFVKSKE